MLANLALFLFFGDDGQFGDIKKLAIKDKKKKKRKKNHCYYLTGSMG